MLNISVLGSNSFIGKHFIKGLSKNANVSITLFGRRFNDVRKDNVKCVEGDFEDLSQLKKALIGQDIVYNFISQTIPSSSWNSPIVEIERNLIPFLRFIDLAAECRVRKICFASSGGTVYGLQRDVATEQLSTEPFSPYGITKRTIECFLRYAQLRHDIYYDIYRISNVYGEGQNVSTGLGFINTALENIINHQPILIYGDGSIIRDYIYVRDVASLMTLSLRKPLDSSDIYNVSSSQPLSLNCLVSIIRSVLGLDFEVKHLEKRPSDNIKVLLDNSKITRHFDQKTLTSIEKGIERTYDFLKKNSSYAKKNVRRF